MSHGMRRRSAAVHEARAARVATNADEAQHWETVVRHYNRQQKDICVCCYTGREADANLDDVRTTVKAEMRGRYLQLAEAHFERAWELRREERLVVRDDTPSRSRLVVHVTAARPGDAVAAYECDSQTVMRRIETRTNTSAVFMAH